ncbi:MAG: hypothetical protein BWY86_00148 [Candidatus Aminicenantes bacterium ADurb.Bin508]|nr:MAG: hypothetical protein BWY86_00148 [Candidatus Aminicenantes bacterium ADurb.Bin508]
MNVTLRLVGKTVVDDMGQIVDIKPPGRHIGSGQDSDDSGAEGGHDLVPAVLGKVSMEGVHVVAVLGETKGKLLCLQPGSAKDNGVHLRLKVKNSP